MPHAIIVGALNGTIAALFLVVPPAMPTMVIVPIAIAVTDCDSSEVERKGDGGDLKPKLGAAVAFSARTPDLGVCHRKGSSDERDGNDGTLQKSVHVVSIPNSIIRQTRELAAAR